MKSLASLILAKMMFLEVNVNYMLTVIKLTVLYIQNDKRLSFIQLDYKSVIDEKGGNFTHE